MDHYDALLDHIQQVVSLSEESKGYVREEFKVKELRKKEILIHQGDVSQHMRFITKGCFKCSNIDEKGKEHIMLFGIEGWWINDLYSYLTQLPARISIQALEPSVILQIHRDSMEELLRKAPVMERFFRIKTQNAYVALQERTMYSMSQSAEQRYLDFRKKYHDIEQRVPQYLIAAYLGITPEFLSNIRKKGVEGAVS
ncbi:Crp/Fnr family transcriptional regulator [Telluribacter humicola]|uniref:Crp/Fnr family transcriptional regulator n=1 Tax=Telluribacter humicola TaxID=1720261 RepID=UPI001A96CC59|nr:Crp/Fnr family transcriptional regulator [Telluribacter humicola]